MPGAAGDAIESCTRRGLQLTWQHLLWPTGAGGGSSAVLVLPAAPSGSAVGHGSSVVGSGQLVAGGDRVRWALSLRFGHPPDLHFAEADSGALTCGGAKLQEATYGGGLEAARATGGSWSPRCRRGIPNSNLRFSHGEFDGESWELKYVRWGRGHYCMLFARCWECLGLSCLPMQESGWRLVHAAHEHPDRVSGRLSPGIRLGCGDRQSAIEYDL